MLKVSGLNAFYGRAQILFDVGLEVGRGEVVALMGRNGAGKSTTMKALMGMLPRGRARSISAGTTSRSCRRTGSRGWAWASCRKTGACSAI